MTSTAVVGVTAGASAPDWLIEELLDRLAPRHGVEIVQTTDEDEYFPPPPELRELLRSVTVAAGLTHAVAPEARSAPKPDRQVTATDMLIADPGGDSIVNDRAKRRRQQTDELIDRVATEELVAAQGPLELAPVAVVIAAYKERENIAEVVNDMPKEICGQAVSVLVVVDGEDDGTGAEVRGRPLCRHRPGEPGSGGGTAPRLQDRSRDGAGLSSPPTGTARPTRTTSRSPSSRSWQDGPTSSTARGASARRM